MPYGGGLDSLARLDNSLIRCSSATPRAVLAYEAGMSNGDRHLQSRLAGGDEHEPRSAAMGAT
jgi:hypothetical protein